MPAIWLAVLVMAACSASGGGGGDGDGVNAKAIPATTMNYVVFAWNDLGMHCLNPTYPSTSEEVERALHRE